MCWSCLRRLSIVLYAEDFGIFCCDRGVSLQFDLGALFSRFDVVRPRERFAFRTTPYFAKPDGIWCGAVSFFFAFMYVVVRCYGLFGFRAGVFV